MATMERRKTLTMNWDGLGDDEDDMHFFETYNRLSTAVPDDLASSSDEDDDYEDSRLSFASAASSFVPAKHRKPELPPASAITPNYDIWMAAPGSITERRRRLLGSMGLDDHKENLKATSDAIGRAITKKFDNSNQEKTPTPASSISVNSVTNSSSSSSTVSATSSGGSVQQNREQSPVQYVLVRSRSEGDIDFFSMAKLRKEEMIGKISKQRLTRTSTEIGVPCTRARHVDGNRIIMRDSNESSMRQLPPMSPVVTPGSGGVGAFFLIKNLDTGKEFIVKEYGENGTWNRLSDLETGKQLTMEEFENTVGHSPFIKDIMRRGNYGRHDGYGKKLASNSVILRSLRLSKRKSASLLKNIKGVASGIVGEREREMAAPQVVEQHQQKKPEGKNKWVKVRQSGKSQKDLSALHLCQEFQAHEGCIWTIKFSLDGRFLASAGEDKVIHVWEVQECEVMSMKPEEGNLTPIHPSLMSSMERGVETQNLGKKKGKFGSKRGGSAAIPEYVHVPENVFTFSEKPYCSFHGHLDEVLDLSWSRSQLLLSSSMDKTVRLWDLDTKTCLKFFAHNDYVTCIQFNPMDDDYFISGSLDAKVRMWNIPARLVVDWTDIHEMVTAVSYTPDGQGVLVGTQKGSCRTYSIEDYKLSQTNTVELRTKKKSQLKKVTGFQFSPSNPSEVLVTSADSRIRIVDGIEILHKFKGFRNANSQMAASFSPNGRFIISASEDSQVYVWKHEEHKHSSTGKSKAIQITQSHEHFPCKDVSVAIPWPCMIKGDPPQIPISNGKKHSKRMLPPLPKKGNNNHVNESASNSPEHDPSSLSRSESGIGDSFSNSKRMLPPNPKKESEIEEDGEAISRTNSGIGDSFSSDPSSIRYGDSPSISAAANPSSDSWSSNYSSYDGSHGSSAIHPSAWGLVIVTAGFGGEIRCYQNFGLPRRMGRQVFGSPA